MHTFIITLTQSGGMSDAQMESIEQYFEKQDVKLVVSREQHKSGLWHMHAVMEAANKQAAGVKRKLVRAWGDIVDLSGPKALDVKMVKPGDESRSAGYVVKEQGVYVNKGWDIKSLLAKRAKALQKDVTKQPVATFMLNEKNVEEIILEYAMRMSMPLTRKEEFIDVMKSMAVEGYSVSRIKPTIVYAQVMARAGSPKYMGDWWEMKLGAQM